MLVLFVRWYWRECYGLVSSLLKAWADLVALVMPYLSFPAPPHAPINSLIKRSGVFWSWFTSSWPWSLLNDASWFWFNTFDFSYRTFLFRWGALLLARVVIFLYTSPLYNGGLSNKTFHKICKGFSWQRDELSYDWRGTSNTVVVRMTNSLEISEPLSFPSTRFNDSFYRIKASYLGKYDLNKEDSFDTSCRVGWRFSFFRCGNFLKTEYLSWFSLNLVRAHLLLTTVVLRRATSLSDVTNLVWIGFPQPISSSWFRGSLLAGVNFYMVSCSHYDVMVLCLPDIIVSSLVVTGTVFKFKVTLERLHWMLRFPIYRI